MRNLTSELCDAVVSAYGAPLPSVAREAAQRSLFNVLGTTIGASQSPASEILIAHAKGVGGQRVANVIGTDFLTDAYHASMINGSAGHFDDYDDTHLETVIHPGTATLATVLASAQTASASGSDVLRAFALGCEVQLRIGVSISPTHYDAGWHITGTCGVFGATVAAGLLFGLGKVELEAALGVAASFILGHREAFGTMTKPLHPGKAAANGFMSAVMAAEGMTAPAGILEEPLGVFSVLGDEDADKRASVSEDFGSRWELERNTFKPYPCGIVSHPAIDAAVELSKEVDAAAIDSVRVRCHPLVPELTGNPDPRDGLEARFSTIHGVAAGLLDGEVGLVQYEDSRVIAPDIRHLRGKVTLEADPTIERAEAYLEGVTSDGNVLSHHVKHARGSLERPLGESDLRAKVGGLVEPVLGDRVETILDAVKALDNARDVGELIATATP